LKRGRRLPRATATTTAAAATTAATTEKNGKSYAATFFGTFWTTLPGHTTAKRKTKVAE